MIYRKKIFELENFYFDIEKKMFRITKLLFMLCKSNNLCSYLESIASKWTAGSWNRARIPVSSGLVSLLQLRSLRSISNLRYCVVGTFSWLDSSNLNWEYWIMCPRGSVGWTHWIPLAPLSILKSWSFVVLQSISILEFDLLNDVLGALVLNGFWLDLAFNSKILYVK